MLLKNKNTIKILVLTIFNIALLLVAQIVAEPILILISMGVYLITMFTSDDETVLPLFLFFLPWSALLKLSPTSISFYSIATILVFFKYLIRHPRFERKLIWVVCGLFVVTFAAKVLHGYGISASYLMFFIMLVAFPFIYKFIENKVDFEQCVQFFAIGIIFATICSLIFGSHPNLIQYVRVVEEGRINVTRLCGFYGDPNFYSAQVVTAFGGLLLIISKKKRYLTLNVALAAAVAVCGMISLSKSFLICTFLVFALWIFSVLFYGPSKIIAIAFVVGVIGFFLFDSGSFNNLVDQYILRFGTSTDASTLTTGRTDLWYDYLIFLLRNPKELIFGQGYTSVFNGVRKGSHNTIIQAVYQLGFFGSIIFALWLKQFKSKVKQVNKRNVLIYVVWIVSCFSMWMGLDMMFFDDFFINIMLFSVGCKYISE